jgi:mRNA-degrading endonuclease RelE of RelBE toxin-antitoxin system
MKVFQTRVFSKTLKKLKRKEKLALDEAIKDLIKKPSQAGLKKGDLQGIRVYKYKLGINLFLLAYTYQEEALTLTLIALGSHENFYRDLKNQIH